jgi:hypothetical protein
MSMRRNSLIGAFHAASLQRKFSQVGAYYLLALYILIQTKLTGILGEEGAMYLGFGAVVIGFYYMGTIEFFITGIVANTIFIGWGGVHLLTKVNSFSDVFFAIIVTAGLWIFLFGLLWFSNNYYAYLKGFTEKEVNNLYKR